MSGPPPRLPRGTTTFLLTDVEGSTRLWEESTEAMHAALAWHDDTIERVVGTHGGRLLKTRGEGDSTFSVFARPSDAVAAALEIQRAMDGSASSAGLSLRVRAAIHTGDAELRGGDYFGPAVNRCARLRAAASGGQTLLSQAAAEVVATALPAGAVLDDLGVHRLKDLARAENVFQLSHADLTRAFPPIASLDSRTHNLPVQLTRFIGRERELATITASLATRRLVTVTGIGGVGKTRTALQAAAEAVDRHRDGSWVVELDAVDSQRVGAAVAAALRLREEPGRDIASTLKDHLLRRDLLLVLDNCEHVVDGAAHLAEELLEAAPHLRVLATSRQPLGVPGEVVVNLAPLPVPDGDDIAALRESDAAALFIDRAALVKPGFDLGPADAAALARVCRDVDGIALALELAAAWVRVLTLPQIAERLGDRFRLLTGGSRTAARRQQTLRAAVDWSYELLTLEEQRVFRALGAYPAGATFGSAAAAAGGDVFDLVVQLVDKSVVVATENDRFAMLNTVRAYALERLRDAGEEAAVRRRQIEWAADLIASADNDPVAVEHENILDLLRWCESHAPADAISLAVGMRRFWETRGHSATAREWLTRLGRHPSDDVPDAMRASALTHAARFAITQGDYDAARELLEDSLARAAVAADRAATAEATLNLGNLAAVRGDLAAASQHFDAALDHARAAGADRVEAGALANLGNLFYTAGDLTRAAEHYDRAIAAARAIGDDNLLASVLSHRGAVAGSQGRLATARQHLVTALELARKLGNDAETAAALNFLGRIELRDNQPGAAQPLVEEALEIHRRLDEPAAVAHSLGTLAEIAKLQGDRSRARSLGEESAAIAAAIGFPLLVASAELELASLDMEHDAAASVRHLVRALDIVVELDSREGLTAVFDGAAQVAAGAGALEEAALLFGAADALRAEMLAEAAVDPGREQARHRAEAGLGAGAYAAAFTRGRTLATRDVVAAVRNLADGLQLPPA